MAEGFTNKEMLSILMDDMKDMKGDIKDLKSCVNDTHELAKVTNGKVRFHTKIIWGLAGVTVTGLITIVGWIIRILTS